MFVEKFNMKRRSNTGCATVKRSILMDRVELSYSWTGRLPCSSVRAVKTNAVADLAGHSRRGPPPQD